MRRRITIIEGHPDPSDARLNHALADRYAQAAAAAGHEVRRIAVSHMDFPLIRTYDDFYHARAPEAILQAQSAITAAQLLVLLYPLWLGDMPAFFKGFLEQTFREGFAMDTTGGQFPKKLLTGKSARIIVTMGMPAFAYRWYFGAHSLKSLERNILGFCGVSPIRVTLLGGIAEADEARRRRWLDQMATLGAAAR
ncbi:flavodoxin family protein [bacterium]|nr:MAG: flavodoxin family protein [bacterium]